MTEARHGAERACLVVRCTAPGSDRDLCPRHAHYFRVVLADPYYRDHECPDIDAPQLALRLDVPTVSPQQLTMSEEL